MPGLHELHQPERVFQDPRDEGHLQAHFILDEEEEVEGEEREGTGRWLRREEQVERKEGAAPPPLPLLWSTGSTWRRVAAAQQPVSPRALGCPHPSPPPWKLLQEGQFETIVIGKLKYQESSREEVTGPWSEWMNKDELVWFLAQVSPVSGQKCLNRRFSKKVHQDYFLVGSPVKPQSTCSWSLVWRWRMWTPVSTLYPEWSHPGPHPQRDAEGWAGDCPASWWVILCPQSHCGGQPCPLRSQTHGDGSVSRRSTTSSWARCDWVWWGVCLGTSSVVATLLATSSCRVQAMWGPASLRSWHVSGRSVEGVPKSTQPLYPGAVREKKGALGQEGSCRHSVQHLVTGPGGGQEEAILFPLWLKKNISLFQQWARACWEPSVYLSVLFSTSDMETLFLWEFFKCYSF